MKKIISITFLFGMLLFTNMLSAQQLSQEKMKAINSDDVATFKKQFTPGDYNKCFTIGNESYSPLGFSSLYGSHNIIKYLLDNKADINKKCSNKTPLQLSDLRKGDETSKLLIQRGAVRN